MKKKVFQKKLVLNKKTIALLNSDKMRAILGGATKIGPTCVTNFICCPQGGKKRKTENAGC